MGILDKKTRFIDLVVTEEGRKQIARGGLRATYASLSDCNAFYDINEADNPSERLYFEVAERHENVMFPKKDDSGKLFFNLNADPNLTVVHGQLFGSANNPEDLNERKLLTGSQFQSVFTGSLSDTLLNNFEKNYFIRSDKKQKNSSFELSKSDIVFSITNGIPFRNGPASQTINVNNADPFFFDPYLSYFKNYSFLPPVNMDGSKFGVYNDLRGLTKNSWSQIKEHLGPTAFAKETSNSDEGTFNLLNNAAGDNREVELLLKDGKLPVHGTLPSLGHETIKVKKTSADNNLILQIFENGNGASLTKLDIIDAGSFIDESDPNKRYEKRLYYVGKVFYDDIKSPTYINMFTIVMD